MHKNFKAVLLSALVLPGLGHAIGTYGERRREDFFVRHLLGVEPPDRNQQPSDNEGTGG